MGDDLTLDLIARHEPISMRSGIENEFITRLPDDILLGLFDQYPKKTDYGLTIGYIKAAFKDRSLNIKTEDDRPSKTGYEDSWMLKHEEAPGTSYEWDGKHS